MAVPDCDTSETLIRTGGKIPDTAGAAFTLYISDPSPVPVLIAVPHAGRAYSRPVLDRLRNPAFAALKLEDRYVDLIGREVAKATGAALLIADAPRAMIDLNRATDDVDWEMIQPGTRQAGGYAPGKRARSGLGLIPRRIPGFGELWKQHHNEGELASRIGGIHAPYHATLADTLTRLRDRWGTALLIDLHSMPPLGQRDGWPAAEFVLGDRFGASCHGQLVASAFSYFGAERRLAAHNRPYSGGYVLERHAAPEKGLHAIQLEIDRASYLDSRLDKTGSGFADMVHLLTGLVSKLAGEVAALGAPESPESWAEAAE